MHMCMFMYELRLYDVHDYVSVLNHICSEEEHTTACPELSPDIHVQSLCITHIHERNTQTCPYTCNRLHHNHYVAASAGACAGAAVAEGAPPPPPSIAPPSCSDLSPALASRHRPMCSSLSLRLRPSERSSFSACLRSAASFASSPLMASPSSLARYLLLAASASSRKHCAPRCSPSHALAGSSERLKPSRFDRKYE